MPRSASMAGYSGISYVSKDRASKADRSIEVFLPVWQGMMPGPYYLLSAVGQVTRGRTIDMSRWHSSTAGGSRRENSLAPSPLLR